MAIARLHGGPLDGQVIPLEDDSDRLILPYSETQVVYERGGADEHTGEGDGPTSADFRYVEAEGDIDPSADERDDRSTLDD
ncbi:response regulator [Microbacterium sp. EYE_5]|uniref:response regulator n=1 Tax=unclassified Microbacterium TaxID=2609290 RepID=UPI002002CA9E|nr:MULTISPECIES: response regulator [unclassified Microbacterium]MCK6080417.1 response regulator [Microbacterium sp. EYE_382]MCK6085688.1 response regulator [Microbacterium sp. EYE_384]MCK6124814.1 response regulator [Microbacterium sp. EYE_80]MCK6127723.1 response regulator [Microbacterium sp. EYE_79]MCK6141372.1 response regulator [Microbacterium sp. EYE_39]